MMNKNRPWTGERLETFIYNESTMEHLHRYAIAKEYIKDKTVLDIACGEGYGANLLAGDAKSVLGIDQDVATINSAKKKYIKSNLQFEEGLAESIPVADQSFEVVISFETLEHITEHEKMFREIKRVLKPGGILIISTPDKKNYSDIPGYKNPFHLKELYEDQFREIVSGFFTYAYFIHQNLLLASVALLPGECEVIQYKGDYSQITSQVGIEPLYLIAIASDKEIKKPASSLFAGSAILQTALEEKERSLKRTLSYRIGHFILYPVKLIRNVLKK
jgi:SAM-dependent methyltransferase